MASGLAAKYPLSLITIKRKLRTHSITASDWILELEPGPFLEINPIDAVKRCIESGQVVEVFNDRGKAKLKARVTETVPPGTASIEHGWLPEDFIDGHYNELLHRVDDQ